MWSRVRCLLARGLTNLAALRRLAAGTIDRGCLVFRGLPAKQAVQKSHTEVSFPRSVRPHRRCDPIIQLEDES